MKRSRYTNKACRTCATNLVVKVQKLGGHGRAINLKLFHILLTAYDPILTCCFTEGHLDSSRCLGPLQGIIPINIGFWLAALYYQRDICYYDSSFCEVIWFLTFKKHQSLSINRQYVKELILQWHRKNFSGIILRGPSVTFIWKRSKQHLVMLQFKLASYI